MIMTHKQSHKKSLAVAQRNFVNYIKMLDGSEKPLPEHHFDALFHGDITGMADGHHITRMQLKEKHSCFLKMVTGRRFLTQVGKNSLDVKIRLQNEAGDGHFVRKLVTVKDGKIATSMEYTATLASLYVQESSTKLTVPATRPKYYHSGSTIVECTVASDRTTDQRDQMRRFFIEKNAAARRAFHNLIGDMQ
mmetsp:Transcript_25551/g.51233  ORF Transcript_25551/g.51233 Transcript_25551/m.51233 type:complete len:192 (-) Transcript_25551:49-624(-)